MRALVLICLAALPLGCSRAYYRKDADRETYHAIRERFFCPQWTLPRISITPPPSSRLNDPFNPDRLPMPPDDPAADRYMRWVNGMHGYRHWHRNGDAPWIENPAWYDSLGATEDDKLLLTPDRSIELGVLNSREYQTALETLYEDALTLTLNRYEFALHWFADNTTIWTHFGSSADEMNALATNSDFGFTKMFAAGGQLMVEIMNEFVFEFAGPDHTTVQSNILINFMQPLLRGFGRDVRLEPLTEAERSLLYAVRDFARFRETFSANIAVQTYLQLLLQVQSIRNQEANLVSQEQNLRLNEALLESGSISTVEVDQAFQSYQQARLGLLTARVTLETQLDAFKITLGLPPKTPVRLDDSLLNPFQLNDPALTEAQGGMEKLVAEFRELTQAPPLAKLQDGLRRLKEYNARTLRLSEGVNGEINRWRTMPREATADTSQAARVLTAQNALAARLPEMHGEMVDLGKAIDELAAALPRMKPQDAWETLQRRLRQQSDLTAQLFVIQTQVRVYLIRLRPVQYEEKAAIAYAEANRFDLMNQRGRVVDAWRQIKVAANSLEAVANVSFNANIATKPGGSNPVDFRASASSYSVALQLQAPLDRQAERNLYRMSLITYEQARRAFMALDDQIQQAIRQDLRTLELERLSFEIARQSLVAAARQVEAARDRVLIVENAADTTLTQNILNALNNLLSAKQLLISSWVSYETTRVQLLLDMEALQLDARGIIINEPDNRPGQSNQSDTPAGSAGGQGPGQTPP
jgi:outer membrane protein TolC